MRKACAKHSKTVNTSRQSWINIGTRTTRFRANGGRFLSSAQPAIEIPPRFWAGMVTGAFTTAAKAVDTKKLAIFAP
uniref:Uncharacterized protein n=1 Tax=wastewater metagenome TaxID=527639 RepID=A0A0A8KWR9_9ZZZZ